MTTQFCTFFLDDLFFGVNVLRVQEVLRYQEMTRVPLAPPVVRGLINLRGQIVTAIDLRQRMHLPTRPGEEQFMNVIVNTRDAAISLLVDRIGDVLEMDDQSYDPPPHNLAPAIRNLIQGVYRLDTRLLLILDTEQVVEIETASLT